MSWLSSIVVGLITGLFGLYVAGIVANAVIGWYEMSGVESGSSYFLIFNAVLGGVIAFAIGVVASRALGRWAHGKAAVPALVSVVVIAIVGGATALTAWLLADIPPEIQGRQLNLEVEWRLPAGETAPPSEISDPSMMLASVIDRVQRKKRTGLLKINDARQEDGRWIIPSTVFLFTSRGSRLIEARLGGETIGSFALPLPAKPGPEHEQWSDWWPKGQSPAARPAAAAPPPAKGGEKDKDKDKDKDRGKAPPTPAAAAAGAAAAPGARGAPTAADLAPSYRYRISRVGTAGRPPTAQELLMLQAAGDRATFNAVSPDAPIADWFPYTRFGAREELRVIALRNIVAKPNYGDELAALMLSEEYQKAAEAMYVAAKLPQPPPAIVAGVTQVGRDIALRLDKINVKTVDQDAAFMMGADISIRFAAWIDVARSLRRTSAGDFVPELVAILERSRLRPDTNAIQQDVRRSASHYAKEWAGITPLPDDPPW